MAYQPWTCRPWTGALNGGDLVDVRLEGMLVLGLIGVRVRDPAWGMVPATFDRVEVEERRGGFRVELGARHREGPIDFRWEGLISCDREAGLAFEFSGHALRPLRYNRIGLCAVLHAPAFVGRPYAASGGKHPSHGELPVLV